MSTKKGLRLRGLSGGIAALLLLAGLRVGVQATDIYWTGTGDGTSWSDTNNWDLVRLPTSDDTVWLGAAQDGSSNPIADAAQAIDLDIAGVIIWRMVLANAGAREVTLSSSVAASMELYETGGTHASIPVHMPDTAAANALLNVQMVVTNANWPQLRNDSGDAWLTIGPDGRFNHGTGTAWRSGAGSTRLYNMSGTFRVGTLNEPEAVGITILNNGGPRNWEPYAGSDVRLAANAAFSRAFAPHSAGTSTVSIVESGTTNRVMTFGYGVQGHQDHVMQVVDSPDGSSGNLTIRINQVTFQAYYPNSAELSTRAGDLVEFYATSGTHTYATVHWGPNNGLSGGGGMLLNRTTGGGLNNPLYLENAWTYSGRTMLQSGRLVLSQYDDGETIHYGALPPATIVEIGANGAFDLNGVNALVGGLSDYYGLNQDQPVSSGAVNLDGATLTVNAQTNSSFGGAIGGTGALVKTGAQTLTLNAGYTNAAGRTLRIEDGLLEVSGVLDLSAGAFELAGGRVSGDTIAAGTLWTVTLTAGSTGTPLVTAGTVDLTGATLALDLEYSPALWEEFVLVDAGTLDGASPASLFGIYADGDEFIADDVLFRINYIDDNDSIKLTVIPEPGSLVLLALTGAGLLVARRRRAE